MSDIAPIFLISLPRTGSTLLQRILSAHSQIKTTPEPWILIPFLYLKRRQGVLSEYNHEVMVRAVRDFAGFLPKKGKSFKTRVRQFVLDLYSDIEGSGKYFLDKTPRYTMVTNELMDLFPDAKYIFLYRNPLSVCASMISTWGNHKWCLYRYQYDLYDCLFNMITEGKACQSDIYQLTYEDLVKNPGKEIMEVCKFLEIDFSQEMIEEFSFVKLDGDMGDPTGVKAYKQISADSISKWQKELNNPFRKAWCRRYLKKIGKDRLKQMGYNLEDILHDLNKIKNSYIYIFSDLFRFAYGFFYTASKRYLMNGKTIFPPK